MMEQDVARLVAPEGIAVVGASEDRYYARNVLRNLVTGGFDPQRIYPVNPKRETVAGLRCYPSLASIDGLVSLAIIVTRSQVVPAVIEQAGMAGIPAAIVFADGYAEQGRAGKQRQEELAAVAERAGVSVMGPNTMGFLAPPERTNAWASGEVDATLPSGGVGWVFQSSGMLNLVLSVAEQRLLGVRAAFSVGNEVTFDAADFIAFLADDPQTFVIGALIEGATRPRRLVEALQRARDTGKPVVMLKLGRSERARRSAVAHTGRMVSSGRAWDALLRRLGVVQVRDLDELLNTVSLFDRHGPSTRVRDATKPPGVAFMTISGGDCGLLCDLAEDVELPLTALSASTHRTLQELFDKPDLLGNPLDCENLHKEDFPRFSEAVDALLADDAVDILVARMNLPVEPSDSARRLYEYLAATTHKHGKLFVVLSRANEALSSGWYTFFSGLGVPFLPAYGPALRAMSHLAHWTLNRSRWSAPDAAVVPERTVELPEGRVATWDETQKWLEAAGVPYAPAVLVHDDADLPAAAAQLGFPVAAKLVSAALPHKSDIGGVRLGIRTEAQLIAVAVEFRQQAALRGITLEGIELQAMAHGAVEMIVGVTRDASLGPMIMLGLGGVFTEIAEDVTMTPVPLTEADAAALIDRLRGARLLRGYRGQPPADVSALREVLVSLSHYVADEGGGMVGMECNPVFVGQEGEGVVAVDALVMLSS